MARQHRSGIEPEQLAIYAREYELLDWWENYCGISPRLFQNQEGRFFPEISLSMAFCGARLVAKFDLIFAGQDGRALIVDWKTSRRRPRRSPVAQRLQTRLYPYLLVQAGAALNSGLPYAPEQVEMVYWYAAFPDQPERFPYSTGQCRTDEIYLNRLVMQIGEMEDADFLPTEHLEPCRFCVYRSLCGRGEQAGQFDELEPGQEEPLLASDFSFEQIVEVVY
jgi:hypothetical protein